MKIRILPYDASAASAVERSGAEVASETDRADGLVAHFGCSVSDVVQALETDSSIGWVQLPSAGIEKWTEVIAAHPTVLWTSAKGAYAEPVAEHALALTLALLRNLKERSRATRWGSPSGTSLHGCNIVLLGAGGVAQETARLLGAFRTSVTVVRRLPDPVDWASRTISLDQLDDVLPDADVVIVAAALTGQTRGLFDAARLALLKPRAVLVNIARGALVDSDALVGALYRGELAGAALDVTDPEPLPDGHALWAEPLALITPHTADTMEMIVPLLAERIADNVARLSDGRAMVGQVDPAAGY